MPQIKQGHTTQLLSIEITKVETNPHKMLLIRRTEQKKSKHEVKLEVLCLRYQTTVISLSSLEAFQS